jgi:hypothetical protein
MKKVIINIIEVVNGTIQTPASFIIEDGANQNEIIKNAEDYFLQCAKENGMEDSCKDEVMDNEEFKTNDGYEVYLMRSKVINSPHK